MNLSAPSWTRSEKRENTLVCHTSVATRYWKPACNAITSVWWSYGKGVAWAFALQGVGPEFVLWRHMWRLPSHTRAVPSLRAWRIAAICHFSTRQYASTLWTFLDRMAVVDQFSGPTPFHLFLWRCAKDFRTRIIEAKLMLAAIMDQNWSIGFMWSRPLGIRRRREPKHLTRFELSTSLQKTAHFCLFYLPYNKMLKQG